MWARPACVLCDKPCVPLADWDVPVCIGCDERAAVVLAASAYADKAHAAIAPTARRRPRRNLNATPLKPCGSHAAFNRHKDRGEAPCNACVVGESNYQAARHDRRRAAAVAA